MNQSHQEIPLIYRIVIPLVVVLAGLLCSSTLGDTFGIDANTFDIEFVTIGNPGNTADYTGGPSPCGQVDTTYRMGQFEISEQMIDKANTLGGLAITKGTWSPDKPATFVSWNEAARFVNWLNTSSGSPPAYKFALQPGDIGYSLDAYNELWTIGDAGYDPNNLYRNSLAKYFLPSVDEWYKAAYYDPTNDVYYDYAAGSDTAPTPVASGTSDGTAVYNLSDIFSPADITLAGGLSPYGTMAQNGNVHEWQETDFDLVNDSTSSDRVFRGGDWISTFTSLLSSDWRGSPPLGEGGFVGFRVASVLGGDYNGDGIVDAADYVVWRKNDGTQAGYDSWRAQFGQTQGSGAITVSSEYSESAVNVPEPASLLHSAWGIVAFVVSAVRKRTELPSILH